MRKLAGRLYPVLLTGALALLCLSACSSSPSVSAIPTPTPTLAIDLSTPSTLYNQPVPSVTCDQAVQQIEQNQYGLVQISRPKHPEKHMLYGGKGISGILLFPRSARTNDPSQPYDPWQAIDVATFYPDIDCYPRVVEAVKQVNQHLPKDQHVELQWQYDYGS